MDREEYGEWQREEGGYDALNRKNHYQNSMHRLTKLETLLVGPFKA